jgi:hypothetical protein
VAAFDAAMFFFPITHPFVGDGVSEVELRELVKDGMVVLESY